jgi:hypothetical protein
MGRTYRYDGETNNKYKKDKYLQEQKKRQKRRIEDEDGYSRKQRDKSKDR